MEFIPLKNFKIVGNPKYEICVDDTIHCLESVTRNKDAYTSIFDDPILDTLKQIHDEYGTVFNLSLFWRLDSTAAGNVPPPSPDYEIGWTLDRMTDKFKSEWEDNSDWLKFSVHSYDYETKDPDLALYNAMKTEVERFAGSNSWNRYHKHHWYIGSKSKIKEIRAGSDNWGWLGPAIHYGDTGALYLSQTQRAQLREKGTFYEPDNKAFFITTIGTVERILGYWTGFSDSPMGMYEYLDKVSSGTYTYTAPDISFWSVETHENLVYWVPSVTADYWEVARWMKDNGFECGFLTRNDIQAFMYAEWLDSQQIHF